MALILARVFVLSCDSSPCLGRIPHACFSALTLSCASCVWQERIPGGVELTSLRQELERHKRQSAARLGCAPTTNTTQTLNGHAGLLFGRRAAAAQLVADVSDGWSVRAGRRLNEANALCKKREAALEAAAAAAEIDKARIELLEAQVAQQQQQG